ncbi:hypothetical protein PPL_12491 [Heterostelium album PN500]|uniref:HIT domain-containing protein n=1 Tax=Heterostelium pallidum (strain ATCC 26659 / Pp 5 / PN500) TaxID=670386 RepID=D3BMR8_HETP5|nr:hypothetical protein PPL_12491 [Heterostelium album PN500]EFA77280.1 hypothetical protein PPL_12491 [Heterostelium album PN500]|eukprot:XP_020429409.1 hypothetical protein PPL_12491 [Heterostelium album PN500]
MKYRTYLFVGTVLMGLFFSKKRISGGTTEDDCAGVSQEIIDNCVFCNIIKDNTRVIQYQDDDVVVFSDRTPKASTHLLVIPRRHIKSVKTLKPSDLPTVLKMKDIAQTIANRDFSGSAYRLGFHIPPFYSIPHLHLHLLVEPFTPTRKRFNYTPHLGGLWYKSVDTIIESLSKDHIV